MEESSVSTPQNPLIIPRFQSTIARRKSKEFSRICFSDLDGELDLADSIIQRMQHAKDGKENFSLDSERQQTPSRNIEAAYNMTTTPSKALSQLTFNVSKSPDMLNSKTWDIDCKQPPSSRKSGIPISKLSVNSSRYRAVSASPLERRISLLSSHQKSRIEESRSPHFDLSLSALPTPKIVHVSSDSSLKLEKSLSKPGRSRMEKAPISPLVSATTSHPKLRTPQEKQTTPTVACTPSSSHPRLSSSVPAKPDSVAVTSDAYGFLFRLPDTWDKPVEQTVHLSNPGSTALKVKLSFTSPNANFRLVTGSGEHKKLPQDLCLLPMIETPVRLVYIPSSTRGQRKLPREVSQTKLCVSVLQHGMPIKTFRLYCYVWRTPAHLQVENAHGTANPGQFYLAQRGDQHQLVLRNADTERRIWCLLAHAELSDTNRSPSKRSIHLANSESITVTPRAFFLAPLETKSIQIALSPGVAVARFLIFHDDDCLRDGVNIKSHCQKLFGDRLASSLKLHASQLTRLPQTRRATFVDHPSEAYKRYELLQLALKGLTPQEVVVFSAAHGQDPEITQLMLTSFVEPGNFEKTMANVDNTGLSDDRTQVSPVGKRLLDDVSSARLATPQFSLHAKQGNIVLCRDRESHYSGTFLVYVRNMDRLGGSEWRVRFALSKCLEAVLEDDVVVPARVAESVSLRLDCPGNKQFWLLSRSNFQPCMLTLHFEVSSELHEFMRGLRRKSSAFRLQAKVHLELEAVAEAHPHQEPKHARLPLVFTSTVDLGGHVSNRLCIVTEDKEGLVFVGDCPRRKLTLYNLSDTDNAHITLAELRKPFFLNTPTQFSIRPHKSTHLAVFCDCTTTDDQPTSVLLRVNCYFGSGGPSSSHTVKLMWRP